jgi:multidrug resistance efflux pump/pimeloyl-ACP methyl ester carboxylesterase
MDSSNPSKTASPETPPSSSESESEGAQGSDGLRQKADDFDLSSPLLSSKVLRRALQDASGQDYYVYLPSDGATDAPVLVVVHDLEREARVQAEAFAELCERRGVVLVAPHFGADRYPNYQRLGRSRMPADESGNASEALDRILEEVALLSGASTERFHLFGFGAGGRFAMRYALLNPERIAGTVVAQPGAYTFPDETRRFPRGIAPSRKQPDFVPDPVRFLRVPFTLLEYEGDLDVPPPVRLEDVDRDDDGNSSTNGRSWVEAMVEAARVRKLIPVVVFEAIPEPVDSFDAFSGQEHLVERVLEVLLTSDMAGAGAAFTSVEGSPTNRWGRVKQLLDQWDRMRRFVLPALIVAALVAMATPILLWAHYRSTHLISREAVLRGHIAEVGAQLNGVVKQIEVDSGDRVVAGQIVVRLEDRQFQAKRMQAASQLEKARRELEVEELAIENERARQQSSLRGVSADLSAANAALRVSESRAEEALRRLELQSALARDGLVAEERVRTAETELRTARALVSAAGAERTSAIAGKEFAETVYDGLKVREKRVSVLESAISALAAELALAEANLESTIIRAPEDGAVVRRIVEPGGSTVAGQPIISLWLGRDVWVEAWIDEDEFGEVSVGSRATVTFISHPDREFGGVVESLAVATDTELPDSEVPQARQDRMRDAPVVSARVKLDPHEQILIPGLSAIVAIHKQDD